VVGPDGVGKSAVALGVLKYVTDRVLFADSVCLYRATDHGDFASFANGLKQAILSSGTNPLSATMNSLIVQRELEMVTPPESEDLILDCLEWKDALLVLDQVDDFLQGDMVKCLALQSFLTRLFQRCQKIKVIAVRWIGTMDGKMSISPADR
jgi:hypothetical protein